MNRIVVLGVAMFFALVGLALVGGEQKASASLFGCRGCHGCSGCNSCGGYSNGCCASSCHSWLRCSSASIQSITAVVSALVKSINMLRTPHMNAIRPQTLVLLYRQTYLPPARSALPHC